MAASSERDASICARACLRAANMASRCTCPSSTTSGSTDATTLVRRLYEKALAPLGVTPVMEYGARVRLRSGRKLYFWVGQGATRFQTEEQVRVITPIDVVFVARSRAEVDVFHAAALAAGGRDNGAPRAPARVPPGLLRCVRAGSRRPQHRGGRPLGVIQRASVSREMSDARHARHQTPAHARCPSLAAQ